MRIGIVGLGYWGSIILKNLVKMGYNDILVCEVRDVEWENFGKKFRQVRETSELDGKVDYVFVCTPFSTHYDVCSQLLSFNSSVDIFCEKPLAPTESECKELYEMARVSGSKLFVDWTFLHNKEFLTILDKAQKDFDLGELRSVHFKRKNYGPSRKDTSAKWDLSVHDVSMAVFISQNNLGSDVSFESQFIDFYINRSETMPDSCLGWIKATNPYSDEKIHFTIETSWSFNKKDRLCQFNFENAVIEWDDVTGKILMNDIDITKDLMNDVPDISPLEQSIRTFFSKNSFDETMTLNITKIIQE